MSEMETAGSLKAALPGDEIVARINELGNISEAPGQLTRIFLSKQHRAAADLILRWMREAGMRAHLDAIGNVCGRYEGDRPGLPCLMLGSHYDTVRDAGKWDGPLGVITAIACVADLNRRGVRLPFAIEVVGFADEEGVRFASTLLGCGAMRWQAPPNASSRSRNFARRMVQDWSARSAPSPRCRVRPTSFQEGSRLRWTFARRRTPTASSPSPRSCGGSRPSRSGANS